MNFAAHRNSARTPKAPQEWTVGLFVSVGFVRGLRVVAKNGNIYVLEHIRGIARPGEVITYYTFQPHNGLVRHYSYEEAMRQ